MMSEEKTAPLKISLVTTKRDEIFAIGRLIAEGLEPEFLQDRKRPVFVSICGSLSAGKTIIAEEGRAALTGDATLTRGEMHYSEYWTGRKNDKPLEIDYTNIAFSLFDFSCFNFDSSTSRRDALAEIFNRRRAGGVTYVQNSLPFGRKEADIAVWVEDKSDIVLPSTFLNDLATVLFMDPQAWHKRAKRSPLHDAYKAAAGPWKRYIEIEVRDPRLIASEKFQKNIAAIAAIGRGQAMPPDLLERISQSSAYLRRP